MLQLPSPNDARTSPLLCRYVQKARSSIHLKTLYILLVGGGRGGYGGGYDQYGGGYDQYNSGYGGGYQGGYQSGYGNYGGGYDQYSSGGGGGYDQSGGMFSFTLFVVHNLREKALNVAEQTKIV